MPHKFEWMGKANSPRWLIGNSQMANFWCDGEYQILYKRGGKISEIVAEAEWVITHKQATHVIIDGIQNSVKANHQGILSLEKDIMPRLKALNKRAQVVLAEVLYCPEHLQYEDTLHLINRQVRRINREASGLKSPQPWRALSRMEKLRSRKGKKQVEIFPSAFARDNYHINKQHLRTYERKLNAFMVAMVEGESRIKASQQSSSTTTQSSFPSTQERGGRAVEANVLRN